MKKHIILFFVTVPLLIIAQDKGIQFEHGTIWKEVQAKAKSENKYIFVDCFTTWCGPCKRMSSSVFPLKDVGDFMNDKFLSVKLQLDTTKDDDQSVKSWYQDGHDLADKYNVRAYPTYLIFDPNGIVVHRFVGASPAEEFIASAKNSLNPETQYYTLLNQYKSGKKNNESLRNLALAAASAYDLENGMLLSNEYLATQSDLYTKENLNFIAMFTKSSADKGFDILMHNPAKVDAILGKGTAESMVQSIIMGEEIFRYFPNDPSGKPDWEKISTSITKKYPSQALELIAKAKVMWYQQAKDWNNYQVAVIEYMNKYGNNTMPGDLNNYAWTVFQNCPDKKCLSLALKWSKRSIDSNNVPAYMDTYANILYKLGKRNDALKWEQKAMEFAPDAEKKGYQEIIDKMKKNEKTWN